MSPNGMLVEAGNVSVPALTMVPPLYELKAVPDNVVVPEPFWTTMPVPVIALPAKSVPWAAAFERSNTSVPLSVMALPVGSVPVEPPLPISSVPALIVVAPL